VIDHALDPGHTLDDVNRLVALKLIGDNAAQFSGASVKDHFNAIALQLTTLAEVAGDGVRHFLVRRVGRGRGAIQTEAGGLLSEGGANQRQPQGDGKEIAGTE
jgi:hypothetical protein